MSSDHRSRPAGGGGDRGIRILLADDHPEVRIALKQMLSKWADFEVVGEARDGREAVEECRRLLPDVVIMDVSMPEMNGIEATWRISECCPDVGVLGLSMYDSEPMLRRMMERAGARAFVVKSAPASVIRETVRSVARSGSE
ncbi:response regulator transcription factor [Haloferula sp. A504]|uniref:response regulator transcription factor n=1 Tax=Haloferula sp. A504 TaxID=3373601 RepID=UPI0037BE2941